MNAQTKHIVKQLLISSERLVKKVKSGEQLDCVDNECGCIGNDEDKKLVARLDQLFLSLKKELKK